MKRLSILWILQVVILIVFSSSTLLSQELILSGLPATEAVCLPEDIPSQPAKDWYIARTKEIGIAQKVPIIQVAYKTRDRKFFFETANFDFVTASPDLSTVFLSCSMSKPVFAYIVLRLVDKGLIDIDRPLYEYTDGILEDRFCNAIPKKVKASERNEEWAKRLTARIVLTHGTGLPNWMEKRGEGKIVFENEPGKKYTYSGEGFHYLQRVVEHITGKTLNELADEEVFIPLGMVSSSYKWRKEYAVTHAYGYDENMVKGTQYENTLPHIFDNTHENSAYTLRTNVKDYSLFLEALMEGRGLKPETFKEMVSLQRALDASGNTYTGLGIRVHPNKQSDYGPMWQHGGSTYNFRCWFCIFPKEKSYFVYFTNSSNGYGATQQALYKLFFPQYSESK